MKKHLSRVIKKPDPIIIKNERQNRRCFIDKFSNYNHGFFDSVYKIDFQIKVSRSEFMLWYDKGGDKCVIGNRHNSLFYTK